MGSEGKLSYCCYGDSSKQNMESFEMSEMIGFPSISDQFGVMDPDPSAGALRFVFPCSNPLRASKYLGPAQELLNELCNIVDDSKKKIKDESETSTRQQQQQHQTPLYSVDLQTRKLKLFQMLQEVDTRYKHYCDEMKGVVSSFECVAGKGSASVYSGLAWKAMSRHFRCLRDAIVKQIKATRKDGHGHGHGYGMRLRVIDETLRQQRAVQQLSMMESHPWRPQRGLPERSVSILRAWLFEHFLHPYPSDVDKHILARQTGLSRSQVSNWFINARVRLWKPMVEEMYMKEQQGNGENDDDDDQKPTADQLIGMDSDCLSSIVNNNNNAPSLYAMDLDFSSYTRTQEVSLTLGLHQQPQPQPHMETVKYSLLDSESQNLPYRNLMGAQLLRDLPG